MKKYSIIALFAWVFPTMTIAQETTLKIATFNVSMEALNYVAHKRGEAPNILSLIHI